jgi:hypothetical protein
MAIQCIGEIDLMKEILSGWLDGACYSMKNSRQLKRLGRIRKLVLSDKAQASFVSYTYALKRLYKKRDPYPGRVTLYAKLYYTNARSDGDVELLKDALQAARVLENDNQIKAIAYEVVYQPLGPAGVHFLLRPYCIPEIEL